MIKLFWSPESVCEKRKVLVVFGWTQLLLLPLITTSISAKGWTVTSLWNVSTTNSSPAHYWLHASLNQPQLHVSLPYSFEDSFRKRCFISTLLKFPFKFNIHLECSMIKPIFISLSMQRFCRAQHFTLYCDTYHVPRWQTLFNFVFTVLVIYIALLINLQFSIGHSLAVWFPHGCDTMCVCECTYLMAKWVLNTSVILWQFA